jgi:hypothetical protein
MRKLLDSRVDQKAFKPAHTSSHERFKFTHNFPGRFHPKRNIYRALALSGSKLFIKRLDRPVVAGIELSGMSTMVVTPPAAAALCGRFESFPFCTARLVHMHMSVD